MTIYESARECLTIQQDALYILLQREIANQNKLICIGIGIATITLLITIFTLWNQRKIKKMLRGLTEAQQKKEPEEGKPTFSGDAETIHESNKTP